MYNNNNFNNDFNNNNFDNNSAPLSHNNNAAAATPPKRKRTKLIFFIVGLALLLIGGIIFGAVVATHSLHELDNEVLTATSFTALEEQQITEINLNGNWNYQIVMGYSFSINYFYSNTHAISSYTTPNQSGGYTFTLQENRNSFISDMGMGGTRRNHANYLIVITVNRPVALTTNGSSVRLTANDVNFTTLTLNGSSLRVNITNSTIDGNFTTQGSSTRVNFTDVHVGNVASVGSSVRFDFSNVNANDVSITGSDSRITWNSGTGNNIRSVGSSPRINLTDIEMQNIYMRGSSARVDAVRSTLHHLEMTGSSTRATLELYGTLADVGRALAQSNSSRLYINGRRQDGSILNPQGTKTFVLSGSSARLRLTMLG